ncbi:MAG TPA: hypothetical protein VMW25_02515 [Clostridia bacterium]|nr:hypothetical protein [Clostridia bacterium]
MSSFRIRLSVLTAFFLRLMIAPWGRHSDCDNFFYWSKYLWEKKDFLGFLGKAVPNAMPAIYPPIFYYLIFLWRGLYELLGQILWQLNLKVSIFPSNLIIWYQSYQAAVAFNKLPAIICDFACAFLIYNISRLIGAKEKLAAVVAMLFLFLPPFWYNSAHWGQIDSLYSFPILLAFYFVLKNNFLLGTFSLAFSALIKPTGLFVLPAFLIYSFRKKKMVDLLIGLIFFLLLAFILYFPFQPLNTLPWAINFYLDSFRGETNYFVSNAFNLWSFLFGFDQRSPDVLFAGFPLSLWGFALFSFFGGIVSLRQWQNFTKKSLIYAAALLSFASFLFLPRIHERYFYTAALFLAILASLNKKMLYLFIVLSVIHQINLYHFWWSPKIPFLITLFSNLTVLRLVIFLNLAIFVKLWVGYVKHETA